MCGLLFLITAIEAKTRSPYLIGISPAFVIDKAGLSTEIDANVAPFYVQFSINKYYDVRLSSRAMFHNGAENRWDNIGGEISFPIFYRKKYSAMAASKGVYFAPFLSAYNNAPKHFIIANLGIEPGYLFLFRNKFSLATGIQIGASYKNYDKQENEILSHFAVKVCFGIWM